MADERNDKQRTVWRRAGLGWRVAAVTGATAGVAIAPWLSLAMSGCHLGPGDVPPLYSQHAEVYAAWQRQQIAAILIWATCVLLIWFEMAHTGRFARLWAFAWGLFGAVCMLVLMGFILQFGLFCLVLSVLTLGFTALQIWVGAEAQKLRQSEDSGAGRAGKARSADGPG